MTLCLFPVPAFAQTSDAQTVATQSGDAGTSSSHIDFRHIEPEPPKVDLNAVGSVKFLTDASFPPYSYKTAAGQLTGFNVTLADALCRDLRLRCEFIVKPWPELRTALERGEGNAILSGVRITPQAFKTLDFTRPFLFSFAKFVVRTENPMQEPSPRALAGKRIGAVAGSVHEAFLKAHFSRSKIIAAADLTELHEALRTGKLDAIFQDSVQAMFWITGETSRQCCRFAGGGYRDRIRLNDALSIAVARDARVLRDALDHGLDRLQSSGQFIRIYRRFFPLDAW